MTETQQVIPLPDGFGLVLDRSVRTFRHGTVLVGGHPGRLIALSRTGADALGRWIDGGRPSPDLRRLGRRLVDAGMAHPIAPDAAPGRPGVTVVVPARDRPESLERCLGSLAGAEPVIVVDDGSLDPAAVAGVCTRHGATVIRRTVNGGPGAARNDALASVATELVAFVDSDCEVSPGWLDGMVGLFADPKLAAVAPRVRPRPGTRGARRTALARYSEGRSALDMGSERGEVGPGRAVAYVPSAALLARLAALEGGFDRRLRVGEDVDLVWRLLDRGWRVRYEPSVTVAHDEPSTWSGLLGRRLRYGTSAGPLALRHPGRLAPVELRAWPTAVAAALVAGHPAVALVLLGGSSAATAGPLRRHGVPLATAARWSALGRGMDPGRDGAGAHRAGRTGAVDRRSPEPAAGRHSRRPGGGPPVGRVVATPSRARSGAVDGGGRRRRRGLRRRGLVGLLPGPLVPAAPPRRPDRRSRPQPRSGPGALGSGGTTRRGRRRGMTSIAAPGM